MELSEHVAGSNIEAIAVEYMGFEAPKMRNLDEANRNKRENFYFEIMRLWREKSAESSKEVRGRSYLTTMIYLCIFFGRQKWI